MGPWALLAQSSGLCRAAVCGTALLAAAPAAAESKGPGEHPCRFAEVARGTGAAALDARSIRLADGREVKLAGLAFHPPDDTSQTRDMRNALDALIRGRTLTLRAAATEPDRYGRLAAFVFVNASETPVQYALLARGLAQAGGDAGGKACRTALLAREQAARAARLGLWADPRYAIRAPGDAELKARSGSFAVVQGEVVSVRQTAAATYINFGRRWSQTLSVAIPRRHLPAFAEEGIRLEALEGRTLRVRGHVEARTGPVIEATGPAQIEIVQDRNDNL